MGEETEKELLQLVRELIQQGEDHVTSDELARFEERQSQRFAALDQHLARVDVALNEQSQRIDPLEAALSRQHLSVRDAGQGVEVAVRIPQALKRVVWGLVLTAATGAAAWLAGRWGLSVPMP